MPLHSTEDVPWSTILENAFSDNAIWLVPLLLVLLQFVLKLFVGEQASWHQTWKNILQSPVDTGFLALSFTGTLIILKPDSVGGLFATALIFLFFLVISIVIWKISPTHTTKNDLMTSSGLILLNYFITGMMLVYSVSLLTRGVA